jgi:FixJ family two-component response regulator
VTRDKAEILILVDDDPSVRSALKFALEVEGFAVRAYADGERLLGQVLPAFGCIILDYKLPGLNGLQVLHRLRRQGTTLPAVLITTPEPHVLALAAAAGVPVVEKPLLASALVDAVRGLMAGGAPPAA